MAHCMCTLYLWGLDCFVPKRFESLKKNSTFIREFHFSIKLIWLPHFPPFMRGESGRKGWLMRDFILVKHKVISEGFRWVIFQNYFCPLYMLKTETKQTHNTS